MDWLLDIFQKPFSDLTLLDIAKVVGTFVGLALIGVLYFTLVSSKSDRK